MKIPIASLRVGQQRCYAFDSRSVLVCRTESGFFAIENRCPHAEFPLFGGSIVQDIIRCPTHGAKFELKTGRPTTNLRLSPVKTYRLTVEGEFVALSLPESGN